MCQNYEIVLRRLICNVIPWDLVQGFHHTKPLLILQVIHIKGGLLWLMQSGIVQSLFLHRRLYLLIWRRNTITPPGGVLCFPVPIWQAREVILGIPKQPGLYIYTSEVILFNTVLLFFNELLYHFMHAGCLLLTLLVLGIPYSFGGERVFKDVSVLRFLKDFFKMTVGSERLTQCPATAVCRKTQDETQRGRFCKVMQYFWCKY